MTTSWSQKKVVLQKRNGDLWLDQPRILTVHVYKTTQHEDNRHCVCIAPHLRVVGYRGTPVRSMDARSGVVCASVYNKPWYTVRYSYNVGFAPLFSSPTLAPLCVFATCLGYRKTPPGLSVTRSTTSSRRCAFVLVPSPFHAPLIKTLYLVVVPNISSTCFPPPLCRSQQCTVTVPMGTFRIMSRRKIYLLRSHGTTRSVCSCSVVWLLYAVPVHGLPILWPVVLLHAVSGGGNARSGR